MRFKIIFVVFCSLSLILLAECETSPEECFGTCFNPEYVWDVETCSCVLPSHAPCGIRCAQGYHLAYDENGKCYCEPDCEFWQHWDEATQNCTCQEAFECGSDAYWDNYYCNCIPHKPSCDLVCEEGQELDAYSCECLNMPCHIECPSGYVIDHSTCKNCSDCECKPEGSSPIPSISDCHEIDCNEGFIFDSLLCKCVVDAKPFCDDGYIYDHKLCACVCVNVTECPDYFRFDENTCSCVCPQGQECYEGYIFDPDLCQCVCEETFDCAKGFVFNEHTCACSCIADSECEKGKVWDEFSCQCVTDHEPQCEAGFIYDHDACECVCEETLICLDFQQFDENTCQCVCPASLKCDDGGFLNLDTCQCEHIEWRPS